MTVTIYPSQPGGTIEAIASKTHAHRLLICAALSQGRTRINCRTTSEDIQATASCLRAMGARIIRQPYGYFVEAIRCERDALRILDCGESGSTYRFLLPAVCALGLSAVFKLGGRLPERPMSELFDVLESHGAVISGKGSSSVNIRGKLQPGIYEVPGNISSQYISGLLFALPLLDGCSEIVITNSIESRSYIEATLAAQKSFGIDMELNGNIIRVPYRGRNCETAVSCNEIDVEGDWSNAAFWLAMGAIGSKQVTVTGLDMASVQGDKAVCDILSRFGASITKQGDTVTASKGELKAIRIDAADIPDLVPAIALAAAAAEGETKIVNAGRLRFKESDRLQAVADVINSLGGKATQTADGLVIKGNGLLGGGMVDSYNDHRIAMMAAAASVICREAVTINKAEAVNKSYPAFYDDFRKLGADINCK
jgi:3-phosphoshikimate 1-carboxyvinyltransferase